MNVAARDIDPGRQAILEVLTRHDVRLVLIGGAAAETRGWRGRSEDVDITPDDDSENLARLAAALTELGARLRGIPDAPDGLEIPGGIDSRLLLTNTVWNFTTIHGDLDIARRPAGFEHGYTQLAVQATVEQVAATTIAVLVAASEDIIASKTQAGRPKDLAVLDDLRADLRVPRRPDDTPAA